MRRDKRGGPRAASRRHGVGEPRRPLLRPGRRRGVGATAPVAGTGRRCCPPGWAPPTSPPGLSTARARPAGDRAQRARVADPQRDHVAQAGRDAAPDRDPAARAHRDGCSCWPARRGRGSTGTYSASTGAGTCASQKCGPPLSAGPRPSPGWRRCPTDGFPAAARACLRRATGYFTASMVRNAVTTAIRIGAVCNAPTWVRNAASSTIENGAAATDTGTAASRQVNARPNGTQATPRAQGSRRFLR